MSCRHLSPSSDRREGGVERVKDALGITGIVGAGPIVAAAAELMRNSPRRLTYVRAVCDVSLSVTCSCGDQRVCVGGWPWARAKVGSSLRSVWGSG